MCIFLLFALILCPYWEAFYYSERHKKVGYLVFVDAVLIVDTIMNFFVGYFDDSTKTVDLNSKVVFT